jgi:hypothetical protein
LTLPSRQRLGRRPAHSGGGVGGGCLPSSCCAVRARTRFWDTPPQGYTSASSYSGIERAITWPAGAGNRLGFDYFVESETNYDFFRVYVDGAVVFSTSGRAQGYKELPVSAGMHTVRFEYYKDTSVDYGRDLAYVDRVTALSSSGTIEFHDLDGYTAGTTPYGWNQVGTSTGWVAGPPEPPRGYVATSAVAPTLDGLLNIDGPPTPEYNFPTIVSAQRSDWATSDGSRVMLRADSSAQALYIGLRVPRPSGDAGVVTLLLDANRWTTLRMQGCGATGTAPGQEDRKISISYSALTVTGITQYYGTCTAWAAIPSGAADNWPTVAYVALPSSDPGFVNIEMKITLRPAGASGSEPITNSVLGLAVNHSGGGVSQQYPIRQDALWTEDDTLVWETLDFSSVPTPLQRGPIARLDGVPEQQ